MLLLTVLSLAPAILLMTTSFVRIVVVLGLLRQALGTQQLPPEPGDHVDRPVHDAAVDGAGLEAVVRRGHPTVHEERNQPRRGVYAQRRADPPVHGRPDQSHARTTTTCICSWTYVEPETSDGKEPNYVYYDPQEGETEVPLLALLPAFMLSELKTAFLIGFQIYLPFVIIDIVVASVTISMGMLMLPPVLDLAAVQAAAVRAGRWLALGGADAAGEFSM